ncbi:glycosyltransferase [Gracilimonas sp. BCB1]|uniref:glycosyltransferase n=1 Tax=Gracilimonas sp. BCB1 TaxID=3152362 RepID=UPI0032D93782
MKIALISHLYPTELHPAHGKFIKDQFELLTNSSEHEAELFVPTPYSIPFTKRNKRNNAPLVDPDESTRIKYLSFPKKQFPKSIASSLSKNVLHSLQNTSADLVHIHWLYPDGLCIPMLKEAGFKTVLTIHGSDWYQTRNDPVLVELLHEVLQKTDRVLYSGPRLKTDIEGVYPDLAAKSEVIYNMVDEKVYRVPDKEEKKRTVKEVGWDSSKLNTLTVANIREEKGVDLLVEAIRTDPKLKEIDFHVVGATRGDEYSDQFFQSISKISNIHYHPPVPPNELLNYYSAADIFVLPSRREGFNVSILEAMSCGLPVACTDVGGNSKLVDESTGVLSLEITPGEISAAISNLLSSLKNYNSSHIHNTIKSRFGRKAFQSRLLSQYEKVLSE